MTKISPVLSLYLSLRNIGMSLTSWQSRLLFWKFPFFSRVLQLHIHKNWWSHKERHTYLSLCLFAPYTWVGAKVLYLTQVVIALVWKSMHSPLNMPHTMVVSSELRSLRNSLQHFWKNRHHCGIKLRNATSTDPGNCEQCKWRNKIHRTFQKALSESWLSIEH